MGSEQLLYPGKGNIAQTWCVCIYIYIYVYLCTHIHIYTYVYGIYIYIFIDIHMYDIFRSSKAFLTVRIQIRWSRWSPWGSTASANSQGSGDVEECLHQSSCWGSSCNYVTWPSWVLKSLISSHLCLVVDEIWWVDELMSWWSYLFWEGARCTKVHCLGTQHTSKANFHRQVWWRFSWPGGNRIQSD